VQHVAAAVKNGLSTTAIYGGFLCSDWSYSSVGQKARIAAAERGVAGAAVNAVLSAVLSDWISRRGMRRSRRASVVALVSNSRGVAFNRVNLTAGGGGFGGMGIWRTLRCRHIRIRRPRF